ncbi:MAG: pilus assembly protein, partial [Burkholderiales bacterium]|nr:pilus assembly protein [Burkholderiales bacterium]
MKQPIQQKGVAAVEFAILLPMLLLIAFGITEFGRAMYTYNTLVKATRDAARYAMARQPGGVADAGTQCMAVYGKETCNPGTDVPLAPGLTMAMVSICDWPRCPGTHQSQGSAPAVNLVTVTITGYAFQSFVPFVTA